MQFVWYSQSMRCVYYNDIIQVVEEHAFDVEGLAKQKWNVQSIKEFDQREEKFEKEDLDKAQIFKMKRISFK